MKLFFSEFISHSDCFKVKPVKNLLLAYQGRNLIKILQKFDYDFIKNKTLIIDNGAFSVWKSGKPQINLDKYIDQCQRIKDTFAFEDIYFISLDEIPGKFGKKPTLYEKEKSVEYTIKNYDKMYSIFGKKALPVFHQHEDIKYLDYYLSKTDFLCISPANDESNKGRQRWLDEVFYKLDVFNTKIKTHGLAVTSKFLCERYPWYSVDSASWLNPVIHAQVNIVKNFSIFTQVKSDFLKSFENSYIFKDFFLEKKKKDYINSLCKNIDTYLWLEKYITELWEERGLKWN